MTLSRIVGKKNMNLRSYKAEQAIEDKAAEVRARFATPGKHTIYAEKRTEAQRYIDAINSNKPPADLKNFPYLAREVGISAATPLDLANLWIMMDQAWSQVSPIIEEISIAGKSAAKSAKSQDEIDAIVKSAVDQLDAIGEPAPKEGK